MTITHVAINRITYTKADLMEAIRDHILKNNLDGEADQLNNVVFNVSLDSFDSIPDSAEILTFEMTLADRYS
jgi:hypothetical protein